ncbi:DUF2877 domain-containing protein [Saccharibacillus sp. JS10]|uniref:DUF2877 domain-containing protein n=1 Tax=Saccharibacillus sp. JS10 TaxID=2950552 RepID=UPI00210D3348|nr:DUF2877 domain-containing protein [Saccharibacillus sp. JS10]MCQ4088311.1 DUF2877 domain-containing protein [Saccharibacillus sp. JS10]
MVQESLISEHAYISSYMRNYFRQINPTRRLQGKVHSIFSNGFNLKVGKRLWFVGKGEAYLSAIGFTIDTENFDLIAQGLSVGTLIKISPHCSSAGKQFDLVLTVYVRPQPMILILTSIQNVDVSIPRIPLEDWYASDILQKLEQAQVRQNSGFAAPPLDQIDARLSEGSAEFSADTVQSLIGAGIGLTPSGDDFLQGMILLEQITQSKPIIADFTRQALQIRSTTDVSLAYYQTLFDGYIHPTWRHLCSAIQNRDSSKITAAIQHIQAYGATSGNDSLLGVLTFLRQAKRRQLWENES